VELVLGHFATAMGRTTITQVSARMKAVPMLFNDHGRVLFFARGATLLHAILDGP